jgi:hypothetical protein
MINKNENFLVFIRGTDSWNEDIVRLPVEKKTEIAEESVEKQTVPLWDVFF